MAANDEWRIDEEQEAVEGARFLKLMLRQARADPYFWKWVVVAMHNAVHACFVLALKGTWPVNLLPDEIRKKVLREQHSRNFDARVYDAKIAPFLELYKRVQNDDFMLLLTISKSLPGDTDRDESIEWLNRTRNEFIHTRSMTYIRDVSAYPRRLLHALSVMDFLVRQSGNVHFFKDQNAQDMENELAQVRDLLEAMAGSMHGQPVQ
jgi:hypothetical protein